MVSYLGIQNNYVYGLFMEYISNMKFQLHHLYLVKCFVPQKVDLNCQYLCSLYCVSTSVEIYTVSVEIANIKY